MLFENNYADLTSIVSVSSLFDNQETTPSQGSYFPGLVEALVGSQETLFSVCGTSDVHLTHAARLLWDRAIVMLNDKACRCLSCPQDRFRCRHVRAMETSEVTVGLFSTNNPVEAEELSQAGADGPSSASLKEVSLLTCIALNPLS